MPKDRNDDRPFNVESDLAGRQDLEIRRQRLAGLIGRLIARDWLRKQAADETSRRDHLEERT